MEEEDRNDPMDSLPKSGNGGIHNGKTNKNGLKGSKLIQESKESKNLLKLKRDVGMVCQKV